MGIKFMILIAYLLHTALYLASAGSSITTTPETETVTLQESSSDKDEIFATSDPELSSSDNIEEETKSKRTIDHHLGYGFSDMRYQRQFADQQRAAAYNQQIIQKHSQKYSPQYSAIKYTLPQQNYVPQQSHQASGHAHSLSQTVPTTQLSSASATVDGSTAQRNVFYTKQDLPPATAYVPAQSSVSPSVYAPSRVVLPPVYSQDVNTQETIPYMATQPVYFPQHPSPSPVPILLQGAPAYTGIGGHPFAGAHVIPIIILRLHAPGLNPLATPYIRPSPAYAPSQGSSHIQSILLQYLQGIQQQQQQHYQHQQQTAAQTTQVYVQPDTMQNILYMNPNLVSQTDEKLVYIPPESTPQKESYITKKPVVSFPGSQYGGSLSAKYRKYPGPSEGNIQTESEYNLKYANLKDKS